MSIYLSGQVTIYFENPFWVGVVERLDGDELQVAKVTFGPEPKDYEVYAFLDQQYYALTFSAPIKDQEEANKRIKAKNPKRLQREIQKMTHQVGVRTKAQEAIQKERDQHKMARKAKRKHDKDQYLKQAFQQKQLKKKAKKRGH